MESRRMISLSYEVSANAVTRMSAIFRTSLGAEMFLYSIIESWRMDWFVSLFWGYSNLCRLFNVKANFLEEQ